MDSTIYNPVIPYMGAIPYPLQPGNLIRIGGSAKPNATCFSINLQTGANGMQRSDIALHLSPVFTPPPRLVRNSLENQMWGPEESHGAYFPFAIGQGFEILVLVENDHFKIAVNGQHFTEYHYRLPLQRISHVSIDGDVMINTLKFDGVARSSIPSAPGEEIVKPLGFLQPDSHPNAPPMTSGRPPSPYAPSSLPYPPSPTFGAGPHATSPTAAAYPAAYPAAGTSPYGAAPPSAGYPPASAPYQGYPQQAGGYPTGYPSQPGQYPGTSVVYPGQQKSKGGGLNLGPIAAAGAAALGGLAASSVMGGKHKKHKYGHGMKYGVGPTALLGGVGSALGMNRPSHATSSSIPIGGVIAGGATALAGAYMLKKSPIGKVMKPKKMKKLYKHKYKKGWGGWGSSSSSSSDEE